MKPNVMHRRKRSALACQLALMAAAAFSDAVQDFSSVVWRSESSFKSISESSFSEKNKSTSSSSYSENEDEISYEELCSNLKQDLQVVFLITLPILARSLGIALGKKGKIRCRFHLAS